MSPIAAINSSYSTYQYLSQNYYQGKQKHKTEEITDKDTFEHSTYSPYMLYNGQGQLYTNCSSRVQVTI